MILYVYAIKDIQLRQYNVPQYYINDAHALREFADLINANEPNPISKHPNDYELWRLGTYDTDTGGIDQGEPPQQLIKGSSVKK